MLSRDTGRLHPHVAGLCARLIEEAGNRGIGLMVTSTVRARAEQLALFAQGRKALDAVNALRADAGLGPISQSGNRVVTHAPVSVHEFGLAFDVALLMDGRPTWEARADLNESPGADYEEAGLIGEGLGLTWGGRFTHPDMPHFECTGGLSIAELARGMRPEFNPAPAEQESAAPDTRPNRTALRLTLAALAAALVSCLANPESAAPAIVLALVIAAAMAGGALLIRSISSGKEAS